MKLFKLIVTLTEVVFVIRIKMQILAHTKWLCKYHIVFTPKYRAFQLWNDLYQQEVKQPWASRAVTELKAVFMPKYISLAVFALIPQRSYFTLLHIFSIGFKPGLYAGRNSIFAFLLRINPSATCDLWKERLSMITISPSCRNGAKIFRHILQIVFWWEPLQKQNFLVSHQREYDCHWKYMTCQDSITKAGSSPGSSIATCHVVLCTRFANKDVMVHVFILLESFSSLSCAYDVLAILLLRSKRFL